MTFTDDARAVIALTTRLGDSRRPSLPPTHWHEFNGVLADNDLHPADLFDPALDLETIPELTPERAARVRDLLLDAPAAIVTADELSQRGIWTLTLVDDTYPQILPQRLERNAPPVIFGVGEPSLLCGEGVGIVGSRNVREEGARVAQAIAEATVDLGRPVVSGGARGVDQLAMNAAYQSGGSVVGVLADSLEARLRKSDILAALEVGSTCLITQQSPTAGFSPGAAMGRNKLVYALSAATVVVSTDEGSGGTWAGAIEALKNANGIVAVWRGAGEGPGNAALERRGAAPISSARDLGSVLGRESSDPAEAQPPPVQLGLLDF